MKLTVRVTIVHRNRLFRECLATVLSKGERLSVAQADHTDANRLVEALERERPDVVLIDLNLPNRLAVKLTQDIHERIPGVKIVLLTHENTNEDLAGCCKAGALGFVLEESSLHDLQVAIEKVGGGEAFCSPLIIKSLFDWFQKTQGRSESDLTRRELEIVGLIAERLSNKQIARRLSVSLYTVKNHIHSALEKLQVSDRYEAVECAYNRHLLPRPKFPQALRPDG